MGMSTDGQLCVRPMPTAGCAMSKVRRQSCQYSLRGNSSFKFGPNDAGCGNTEKKV